MYTIHWIQFGPLWIWWAWMQHSYGPWSWQTLLCFGGGKSIFSGWYKFHDPNTWKKKEIDKVWFRLNPLTEQNCEKEKKEINMKQQWSYFRDYHLYILNKFCTCTYLKKGNQASLISTLSSMRAIGILSPCLFRREKWR